ncbi:MAG TPA: hypothetical protein VJJ82_04850, partial [Candidatus Nanoarchaeia archaeon]|nr:hypothetical protein [Candidatus Nanoarchaeia archaeon]
MKPGLFLIAWIAFALPIVQAVPIAYFGNITTSIQITQSDLPATFTNTQTQGNATYDLRNATASFGLLRLGLVLDSAGGPVVLLQNGTPQGDAIVQVNAITNLVNINEFTLDSFSDISSWTSSGNTFAKNFSYTLVQAGNPVGTLAAELRMTSANVEGDVLSSGMTVGQFAARNQVTPVSLQIPTVTNLFAGFVRTQNNRNYHGQAVAALGPLIFTSPILAVANRTGYGFGGTPLLVSGPLNSTVQFHVNNYFVRNVTLTSDPSVQRIDLVVPVRVNDPNFPDEDLDGVPDALDECTGSITFDVDSRGCTCEQLLAVQPRGTCTVGDAGPIFNPPEPECTQTDSCIGTNPGYCNANKSIVNNCVSCGCPDGYDCNPCPDGDECITDGGCYKVLEPGDLIGQRCMINKFQVGGGLDCSQVGAGYVDFLAVNHASFNDYIHIHTSGSIFSDDDEVEDEVNDNLQQMQVCVDTVDLGCVTSGTRCPGQEKLATYLPEITAVLQQELDKSINQNNNARSSYDAGIGAFMQRSWVEGTADPIWGVILAIGALFGTVIEVIYDNIAGLFGGEHLGWFDVDIDLSIKPEAVAAVKLNINYPCDTRLVPSTQSCTPVINNGDPENKIDLLFIGDGYTAAEFNSTLASLLDYRGNAT